LNNGDRLLLIKISKEYGLGLFSISIRVICIKSISIRGICIKSIRIKREIYNISKVCNGFKIFKLIREGGDIGRKLWGEVRVDPQRHMGLIMNDTEFDVFSHDHG